MLYFFARAVNACRCAQGDLAHRYLRIDCRLLSPSRPRSEDHRLPRFLHRRPCISGRWHPKSLLPSARSDSDLLSNPTLMEFPIRKCVLARVPRWRGGSSDTIFPPIHIGRALCPLRVRADMFDRHTILSWVICGSLRPIQFDRTVFFDRLCEERVRRFLAPKPIGSGDPTFGIDQSAGAPNVIFATRCRSSGHPPTSEDALPSSILAHDLAIPTQLSISFHRTRMISAGLVVDGKGRASSTSQERLDPPFAAGWGRKRALPATDSNEQNFDLVGTMTCWPLSAQSGVLLLRLATRAVVVHLFSRRALLTSSS